MKKIWTIEVEHLANGLRGIFCTQDQSAMFSETEHTPEQINEMFNYFTLFRKPKSILLTEKDLENVTNDWYPFPEFRNVWGLAPWKESKGTEEAEKSIREVPENNE